MRVSFLEAQQRKWRWALASMDVLPTASSPASRQMLCDCLQLGKAAAATAPAGQAAMWKQVPAHAQPPACISRSRGRSTSQDP